MLLQKNLLRGAVHPKSPHSDLPTWENDTNLHIWLKVVWTVSGSCELHWRSIRSNQSVNISKCRYNSLPSPSITPRWECGAAAAAQRLCVYLVVMPTATWTLSAEV